MKKYLILAIPIAMVVVSTINVILCFVDETTVWKQYLNLFWSLLQFCLVIVLLRLIKKMPKEK